MDAEPPRQSWNLTAALVSAVVAALVAAVVGAAAGFLSVEWALREDETAAEAKEARMDADVHVGLTRAAQRSELRFDVPKDAVAVRVRAWSDDRAVELQARFEDGDEHAPGAFDAWTGSAEVHDLHLVDASGGTFAHGRLVVRVEASGRLDADETVHVRVRAELSRARVDGTIAAGETWSGATDGEWGFRRTVAVKVPADASSLRIDLADAPTDLDLHASLDRRPVLVADADVTRDSPGAVEWFVLDAASDPPLPRGGTVWVAVVDPSAHPYSVPFRLVTTLGRDPPEELTRIPPLVPPSDPRERAAFAVVEVITAGGGGSGTFVGGTGRVLTAYHVVERAARAAAEGRDDAPPVVVAVSLEPQEVARELFAARVVHSDRERDLAMLQVVSGVRGEPLPPGYAFPSVRLSPRTRFQVGETLYTVGHPSAGGFGTRSTTTVSRGVVCGRVRAARSDHIKTDAFVGPGSSGGAAFDERWRMVGIPVSISEDDGPVLGHVVPIDAVPQSWWR